MKLARTLLPLVLLLTCSISQAQTQKASQLDVRTLLIDGQFQVLEQHFGQIQRNYVDGKISDEDLRASFRVFYDTKPPLEEAYSRWVAQSPKSYVAHLARGTFYKFLGSERRGGKFASQTRDDQFAGMLAAHRTAEQELALSMKLDRKPILSYLHMIELAQYMSDDKGRRERLDRGLALDPKTFILREKYLGTLTTRWGGSPEEMRAFVDESRRAGLTQNQMARLNSYVVEDEGWVAEHRGGDKDKAIEKYRQAALLDPKRACEECGPSYQVVSLLQEQGRLAEAVTAATRHLEANPDAVKMRGLRAYCYLSMGKKREGFADYLQAAEMGDAYAQTEIAKAMFAGDEAVPRDIKRAKVFIQHAAQQGYQPAIDLLPLTQIDDSRFLDVKP